jgi:hypothetical protein
VLDYFKKEYNFELPLEDLSQEKVDHIGHQGGKQKKFQRKARYLNTNDENEE